MKEITDIKQHLVNKAKETIAFEGYLHYFYNTETGLNSDMFPLPQVKDNVRLSKTGEVFELGKPAYQLRGKNVFIVVRKIPYSIQIKLITKNTLKDTIEFRIKTSKNESKTKSFLMKNLLKKYGYSQKEIEEMKQTLIVQKGYSAGEIDAKTGSVYTNRIFRAKSLTTTHYIIYLLSVLSSVLSTLVLSMLVM